MTAEIAVMNKWAVALAADSKVTISGTGGIKTYDTVNKLFTLSKYHPIGVMIYGNAEFMDYPWETIIKLYRSQKGDLSEKTVSEWAKDFIAYLRRFGSITQIHKLTNLSNVCLSWISKLTQEAESLSDSSGIAIGSPDFIDVLKQVITENMSDCAAKELWMREPAQKAFIKTFGSLVDKIVNDHFSSYGDTELSELAEQFISAAIFTKIGSPQSSGIVFAGFGENEIFPTLIDFEVDGYIGGSLKIFEKNSVDISRQITACIQPFAQHDMVQRFMTGVDLDYARLTMYAFEETLEESCAEILERYGSRRNKTKAVRDKINDAINSVLKELWEEFREYQKIQFSNPVVRMVSMLPKDELANLAESLVSLTSLKRRVSSDDETVGGPVDVALISKGDGFVWIRRKHYFSPDLNPHFNRVYLREPRKESGHEKQPRLAAERGTKKGGPKAKSTGPAAGSRQPPKPGAGR